MRVTVDADGYLTEIDPLDGSGIEFPTNPRAAMATDIDQPAAYKLYRVEGDVGVRRLMRRANVITPWWLAQELISEADVLASAGGTYGS